MTTVQTPEAGGPVSARVDSVSPSGRPPGTRRAARAPRWLRRSWAYLTSMRTALLLLFLLAFAAVPGSVFPQRGVNPIAVDRYLEENPVLGPVLDRLWMFDVYASPWFAAIYLLLAVSLVGCLLPRLKHHVAELRRPPPRTPRRLDRLPAHASYEADPSVHPREVVQGAAAVLRRRAWRTHVRTDGPDGDPSGVAAEKGYMRETGNLLFHVSILVLLGGLAWGAMGGWRGTVLVQEGETACTTMSQFDQFTAGALVSTDDLPEFCLTLDDFTATYRANGMPEDFVGVVSYGAPGGVEEQARLRVNSPLRLEGTRTYLLNHGFSPVITVVDPEGQMFEGIRAPFLPQDAMYTSEGVFKLPDAKPSQYGFEGYFLPTRPEQGPPIVSMSPEALRPAVTLLAYQGDLGLDGGVPQSVYSLDATRITSGDLERLDSATLEQGETWTLPDGSTVRFDGYDEWATLQVARDPGQFLVLASAVTAILGLVASLLVRRRRLWLRVSPNQESGATVVEVGGLARTDTERFRREFDSLVAGMAVATRQGHEAQSQASDRQAPEATVVRRDI